MVQRRVGTCEKLEQAGGKERKEVRKVFGLRTVSKDVIQQQPGTEPDRGRSPPDLHRSACSHLLNTSARLNRSESSFYSASFHAAYFDRTKDRCQASAS